MRRTVIRINSSDPIVSTKVNNKVLPGVSTEQFRILLLQVYELGLIIGTGSPDGVIDAQQGQEYMDESGSTGNVKYIKQLADIGGDRTLGWKLIG